jgi:hypothetical protein
MAKRIALVPYSLRLWNKNEQRNYVTNRLPNNSTLQNQVEAYLQSRHARKSVLNAIQSVVRTDSQHTDGTTTQGILKCGEYGFAADLENLQSGRQFRRAVNDCEYLPFFFRFTFRDGQDEAIVLLQRFGVSGIKTVLEDDLGSFVENRVPHSKLSLNPIVSEEYIREILGGGIKRLRYTKYYVPADVADDIGATDHIEDNASMELVIKAKRNEFLSIPDWMRAGRIDRSNTIEISGIEYDDVKIQVDIEGQKKTVDLSDIQKFRMSLDVTDEVQTGSDGHPTYSTIRIAADNTMPLIQRALRWEEQ